jgi:branched-subunit amino acid aminotransferase/4-amino-4-deoxychorismate lyase
MDFILLNGKIIRENELNASPIWWRDDLHFDQDMWFVNGEIPHFAEHYQNLIMLLNKLEWSIPPAFPSSPELLRLSKRLINKNKAFMAGWAAIRCTFHEEESNYVVSVRPHPDRLFPLDLTGKTATISPFIKPSGSLFSGYFFNSGTLWKTEKLRHGRKPSEESVFLNEKGMVTEADSTNLFCILKNQLYTPSLQTGCINDIMRQYVINAAQAVGFGIIQSGLLTPADLNGMEEIFLVSEGKGFKWIKGIGGKRFLKNNLELIWRQVNKSSFGRVS